MEGSRSDSEQQNPWNTASQIFVCTNSPGEPVKHADSESAGTWGAGGMELSLHISNRRPGEARLMAQETHLRW